MQDANVIIMTGRHSLRWKWKRVTPSDGRRLFRYNLKNNFEEGAR